MRRHSGGADLHHQLALVAAGNQHAQRCGQLFDALLDIPPGFYLSGFHPAAKLLVKFGTAIQMIEDYESLGARSSEDEIGKHARPGYGLRAGFAVVRYKLADQRASLIVHQCKPGIQYPAIDILEMQIGTVGCRRAQVFEYVSLLVNPPQRRN